MPASFLGLIISEFLGMENHTGILEIRRWALIQACRLCFRRSWVCLHTQGPGPKPEKMFMILLWNVFKAPQVPRERYLQVNISQEIQQELTFMKTWTPTGRPGEKMRLGMGWGGHQMPEAAFEIWVPLNALHLNTFSFRFETWFTSQSIKTMCFWFVNIQLIIKVFPDVEEIPVDSWILFLFIAPGKKTKGKWGF